MSHDRPTSAGQVRLDKVRLSWITLGLHLGFTLTGIGTVLLGCILPRLSAQGHLRDKDAGLLLMAQFAAAAFGALLVRSNFWRTLAFGYALVGVSSFSIVLLQARVFLPAFALLGLGLGLAMTSTSMLIGRLYPARKGSALAILNFSWSAGAVLCPLLVARFLSHAGSSIAYAPVALLAALHQQQFRSCGTNSACFHLGRRRKIDRLLCASVLSLRWH
jgi:FHS family glucose/mannose:H+ symporter-like MFS transporter